MTVIVTSERLGLGSGSGSLGSHLGQMVVVPVVVGNVHMSTAQVRLQLDGLPVGARGRVMS